MLLVENVTVVSPPQVLPNRDVWIAGSLISAITPHGQRKGTPARRLNGRGRFLSPGWLELQLNGGFGKDFTEEPTSIWEVAARLPEMGITAFLPTVITAPAAVAEQARAVLAQGAPAGWRGAVPLGLHIEGPFLNPKRKGAHPPAYLRPPDPAWVRNWSPEGQVRLVTLAPELPGALDLVRALRRQGVAVSMGHTEATLAEAEAGFRGGITYGTHLFNAMRGLHHREPGAVGALLAHPEIAVGMIVDGIHVHPAAVALAWRCKTPETVTLVTDACAGLGMPQGRYRLGAMEIVVQEDRATLPDGTLAGSILRPAVALRNLMEFTGCTVAEAVTTLTAAPARVLGLPRPRVAVGEPANLTLFALDGTVAATIIGGQVVWENAG